MAQWWVYVVECQGGYLYTGISVDVQRRFAAHKQGRGARFMRLHPPERVLAVAEFNSRSEASQCEYWLKQQPKEGKRSWVARHALVISA